MRINFSQKKMFFIPLGGCNEIGLNMNLYCYNSNWIAVDCGCGFAKNEINGCEITIPNISWLIEKKIKLKAIFITHSHEDHVGALSYLIGQLKCDVYATEFTLNVIKNKLYEYNKDLLKSIRIKKITPEKTINVGPFKITGYTITHSSPQMQSLHIATNNCSIFHTGDWKLDDKPILEKKTSLSHIKKKIGTVNTIVCDSTNVLEKNKSGNEGDLLKSIKEEIKSSKGLTVVTTFASNVSRLKVIYDAAIQCNKKVAISGLSMDRALANAEKSNYLTGLSIYDIKKINKADRNEYVILSTGCQGEERASLSKMINGEHRFVKLKKNDKVIFSSKIIPGNEISINNILNILCEKDIDFVTEKTSNIHTSGHPGQKELIEMYKVIKPQSLIPVHGDSIRIRAHCAFARKNKIHDSIFVKDGSIIQIESLSEKKTNLSQVGYFENKKNALDGKRIIPLDSNIIKERNLINKNGIIFTTIIILKDEFEFHFTHQGIFTKQEFDRFTKEMNKTLNHDLDLTSIIKNKTNIDQEIDRAVGKIIKNYCNYSINKIPETKFLIINKL